MAEENTGDFNEEKESAEAEAAAKVEAEKSEEGTKEEEELEEKEEEEKFDEEEEPPTRESAKDKKDYIIERKEKKIEKLEKEAEEEDENSLSEEDQKAINKVVSKETEPLKEVLKAQSDKNELEAVILKHPNAKTMEKRIMKYARHKSYQDIPMENIYLMLANGKSNLQAKKSEVKEKDKENASIGHTKRAKSGGEPDYQNMSNEEFNKIDQEMMESQ